MFEDGAPEGLGWSLPDCPQRGTRRELVLNLSSHTALPTLLLSESCFPLFWRFVKHMLWRVPNFFHSKKRLNSRRCKKPREKAHSSFIMDLLGTTQ